MSTRSNNHHYLVCYLIYQVSGIYGESVCVLCCSSGLRFRLSSLNAVLYVSVDEL